MLRGWLAVVLLGLATVGFCQVRAQKVDYAGWKNTIKLTNGLIEVYAVSAVGPRIIDFRPVGGKNIFHVRRDELGKSGEKEFRLRGGWRPWLAPEIDPKVSLVTWFPDNVPCQVQFHPNFVRLIGPKEPDSGIQKVVDIALFKDQPRVRVTVRLRNVSKKAVTYSAWSLPVLKPGGRAIVPLDVGDLDALAETRKIILWSYGNPTDPRFTFFNKLIVVDQAKVPPRERLIGRFRRHNDEGKLGVDTKQGWTAYYHPADRMLFIQRFPYQKGAVYPDGGCTVEVYSCEEFIEVECLSPLVTIAPGKEYVFPMEWWLFTEVDDLGRTEQEILAALKPYLDKTKPVK
ncbi:MAG: DUF4380 domain-containing protein [Armatimonadetes bacterium]|nr:DUF4380 domain-containing protein [Armatimonadota bacterium]MDW8122355.1 hypothetical protein [Armatimonadota bacterium]